MPDRTCLVPSCEKPAKSRGWCNTHYERWRQGRDVNAPGDLRSRPRPSLECAVDGCEAQSHGLGLCVSHYSKFKRYGDPLAVRRSIGRGAAAYGTGRSMSALHGYVRVRHVGHPLAGPDGYILEHRYVWYEAGRTIPSGYHIHHINGEKTDNRLENLQMLSDSDHGKLHSRPGTLRKNQYGVFLILTPEEAKEKSRKRCREYQRRKRAERLPSQRIGSRTG